MPVLISPTLAEAPYLMALAADLVATGTGNACSTSPSAAEFLQVVKTFCYVGQCNVGGVESAEKLTLIVDARDAAVVKGLAYLLQSPQSSSRPRVLLISSVQTWAGSKTASAAVASSDASHFWGRLPLTGEYSLYCTENQYATFLLNDKLAGFELCIVPVGLVYGGGGGDLAPVFDALWRYDPAAHSKAAPVLKIPSLTQGANSVPLVHQAALGKTLSKLCTAGNVPLFLPAAGGDTGDIMTLCKALFKTLNGIEDANIACFDEAEIVEEILAANTAHPRTLLWSANVVFDAACTEAFTDTLGGGLLAGLKDAWAEFQIEKNLSAVSVFIAGTPGSGKTGLAKSMCEALGTKYIDRTCGIMHAVQSTMEDVTDADLKKELYELIEAEMTKTKAPPKKGEAEVAVAVDPATFELTDALRTAIPLPLQRRCVAQLIRQDPLCIRRGYVMDLWGTGMVNSWDELLEASTGASNTGRRGPELVIEVQAFTQALVARLCASLGIAEGTLAKAPKDQQATVKALEDKLAGYAAKLGDIVYPVAPEAEAGEAETKAEAPAREFTKSHLGVLDMESHAKVVGAAVTGEDGAAVEALPVSRIFRVNADAAAPQVVLRAVGTQLLGVHGVIGWLSAERAASWVVAASDADAPAGESAAEGESKEKSAESSTAPAPAPAPVAVQATDVQSVTQKRIQDTLNECSADNRAVLVDKTLSLQKYLLQFVMPDLANGMVQIAQTRPADPIAFLADHLDALAADKEAQAEMAALMQFNKLLAIAEGTWSEPEEASVGASEAGPSIEGEGAESVADTLDVASLEPQD